jgi:hypothetical protein
LAFYRLRFYAESPATRWPENAGEYTAFATDYLAARVIDLAAPPLNERADLWTHPTNHDACRAIADVAQAAGIEIIRYQSVRDPRGGLNLAILTCRVFTEAEPKAYQTWRLQLSATGVRAIREFPKLIVDFDQKVFAADPRIAAMKWDR